MRKNPHKNAERYRIKKGLLASTSLMGCNGAFLIPTKKGVLKVIASDAVGWDHVSVSLQNRMPTWNEMCFVKDLFFDPEEAVIQYHPPKSKYINNHNFVLHMWKPQGVDLPMPPLWMV